MRSRGLRLCLLDVAFTTETVRNRPQPFAAVRVRALWPCLLFNLLFGNAMAANTIDTEHMSHTLMDLTAVGQLQEQ